MGWTPGESFRESYAGRHGEADCQQKEQNKQEIQKFQNCLRDGNSSVPSGRSVSSATPGTPGSSGTPVSSASPGSSVPAVPSVPSVGNSEGLIPPTIWRAIFALARDYKARGRYPSDSEMIELAKRFTGVVGPEELAVVLPEAIDKVEHPAGTGPLADALATADSTAMPVEAEQFPSSGMRRLVGLCFELQRRAGLNAFPLAASAAAELLGEKTRTVSNWLKLLVRKKILTRELKGHTGVASEYRWLGETVFAPE